MIEKKRQMVNILTTRSRKTFTRQKKRVRAAHPHFKITQRKPTSLCLVYIEEEKNCVEQETVGYLKEIRNAEAR
jgi:hypothetical protein